MLPHKDQRYLRGLVEGDTPLIEAIYRHHAGPITAWVLKNSGSVEQAKDLFQDAMHVLLRLAMDEDFVLTCPLGGLIFRICRNKWMDELAAQKRTARIFTDFARQQIIETDYESILEKIEADREQEHYLSQSFRQLSPVCQRLLQLIVQEKTTEEAVEILEMNQPSTFYRRKKACLDRWQTLYRRMKGSATETHPKPADSQKANP